MPALMLLPKPPPQAAAVHRDEYRDEARKYVLAARAQGIAWKQIHEDLAGAWSLIRLKQWAQEERHGKPMRGYGTPAGDPGPEDPAALPNSTICGAFGPRGSGKTLTAAWLAREYWLMGRPIIYNPAHLLRFPEVAGRTCTYLSLRDIALMAPQMKGALVLLDELQVNLSKWRATTTASALIRRVVQQTRKIGMDLIITSNSPQEIDYSFTTQLNMHGHCTARMPPDWPGWDDVFVQWTDTHKRYGKGPARSARGRYIDDRIRVAERLWPASEMYPWYDTTITVDPLEVMGLTPDDLRQGQAEAEAGITVAELAVWARSRLIPDLVHDGKTSIMPGNIVLWVEQTYRHRFDHAECCGAGIGTEQGFKGCRAGKEVPLRVTPEMMGAALRKAGLLPRRVGQGQKFPLPPAERLTDWQNGMWAIGDDD